MARSLRGDHDAHEKRVRGLIDRAEREEKDIDRYVSCPRRQKHLARFLETVGELRDEFHSQKWRSWPKSLTDRYMEIGYREHDRIAAFEDACMLPEAEQRVRRKPW